MRDNCIYIPKNKNNTGDSQLFIGLLDKTKTSGRVNRQLSLYMMALSRVPSVEKSLLAKGYKQDAGGDFLADDIYKEFKGYFRKDAPLQVEDKLIELGAVDSQLNPVVFQDAQQALQKVVKFNDTKPEDQNNAFVASVQHSGNGYIITVQERNMHTQIQSQYMREALRVWEEATRELTQNGIKVDVSSEIIQNMWNPLDISTTLKTLSILQKVSPESLTETDAALLLSFAESINPQVYARVKKYFDAQFNDSSIEQIANVFVNDPLSLSKEVHSRLRDLIREIQTSPRLNFRNLYNNIIGNQPLSEETQFSNIVASLIEDSDLSTEEISVDIKNIKSIREATAAAIRVIQNKIKKLENQSKDETWEARFALQQKAEKLAEEIQNQRFYASLAEIAEDCNKFMTESIDFLKKYDLSKDLTLADINEINNVIKDCLEELSGYMPFIESLTILDQLSLGSSISQENINTIKEQAQKTRDSLQKYQKFLTDMKEIMVKKTVGSLLKVQDKWDSVSEEEKLGIADVLSFTDCSYMDRLFYSMTKTSVPIVSLMGRILRDAEDARDTATIRVAQKLREVNQILAEHGGDSSFMFTPDGWIATDRDFKGYYADKKAAIARLKAQGLRGPELQDAIKEWIDNNTEQRLVDPIHNRYETVPNSNYEVKFDEGWQSWQKKYYQKMMAIKGELGSLMPEEYRQMYRPAYVSAGNMEILMKHGLKALLQVKREQLRRWWKGIKPEDSMDYAPVDDTGYKFVESTLTGEEKQRVPILFTQRILNNRGEIDKIRMSTDFTKSMVAYAYSALNYYFLNQISGTLEMMEDYIVNHTQSKDTLDNTKASKWQRGYLRVINTVKQAQGASNTAALIHGMLDSRLYGNKLIGSQALNMKLSSFIRYTSFDALSLNVKGMVNNYIVGLLQTTIEAGAGEFFGFKDATKAMGQLIGKVGDVNNLYDFLTQNKSNKINLLNELFNPMNNISEGANSQSFYNNPIAKLASVDLTFIGYGAGEYLLHTHAMLSVLNNVKLYQGDKEISLFDALEVDNKDSKNPKLVFKEGLVWKNGDKVIPLDRELPRDLIASSDTFEFIEYIKKRIRYANQTMHGAMNSEDKGLIHRYILGRMIMNLRQWMVGHYSRRFRSKYFDADVMQFREGYYVTLWKLAKAMTRAQNQWNIDIMRGWNSMTKMQKHNVRRAATEIILYYALLSLVGFMGDPGDHKGERWYRFALYLAKRALMEERSSIPLLTVDMPWGLLTETMKLFDSPVAATTTFSKMRYYFMFGDLNEQVQRGPHKGENKYWHGVAHKAFFTRFIKQMEDFGEDDSAFAIFNTQRY